MGEEGICTLYKEHNMAWTWTDVRQKEHTILWQSFCFPFFGYTKFCAGRKKKNTTKTCRGRNSVAILKEYFQSMLMDVTKYARNIDPSTQKKKKKKKKKIHKTCLLIGRGSFVATKNFEEIGPHSVCFHWKTSCIPLINTMHGFRVWRNGSFGINWHVSLLQGSQNLGWRYDRPIFQEPSRIWSTYLFGGGGGGGAVDWVVGTYWKDRRTLFFPLKRKKICQIRSDWQLSGVLAKEVIRACTLLQGPCSDSNCPLILYYIYTQPNLTGFFFRIWKLSTLSKTV